VFLHLFSALLVSLDKPLDILSFPTRRSSDLACTKLCAGYLWSACAASAFIIIRRRGTSHSFIASFFRGFGDPPICPCLAGRRMGSEEHTSELQSRFDLVCRLLLDKKKR